MTDGRLTAPVHGPSVGAMVTENGTTAARVMWFRRDLRLADHPALTAAADGADVVGLYVLDPRLLAAAGPRARRLVSSLAAFQEATDGALVIRTGDPEVVVPQVAAQVGAGQVHISAETRPYGRRRDSRVGQALREAGVALVATGSPYAVTPGRVRTASGDPYRVFTPFLRAWREHGWRRPLPPATVRWRRSVESERLPEVDGLLDRAGGAGEDAALRQWAGFLRGGLRRYGDERDRPDLDSTSRLSIPLTYGEIHPRTLLADLADRTDLSGPAGSESIDKFVTELAWREFYADALWHRPEAAWHDYRDQLRAMAYDDDPEAVQAWKAGRTGYPFVDAGMRQLQAENWMHNRVRMVVASFLVKDLHQWWPVGARHFLDHLLDGDLASNNHGWQWVAGTGTDAAPYFRVFNPVTQGRKFDPDGQYVRRWIPELRHLAGPDVHEPWKHLDGYAHGYPARIVDHAEERRVALDRYAAARGSR